MTLREEIIRQSVGLGFLLILAGIVTIVDDREAQRRIKMRAAWSVKRVAQRQADSWQYVADRAATEYQKTLGGIS